MNTKNSINLSIWAVVAITAVLSASLAGLVAVLVSKDDKVASPNDPGNSTTSIVDEVQSTTSQFISDSIAPVETTIDSRHQIESIAASLDPKATFSVAEGDCPTVAAVLANQSFKFYKWQDPSWLEVVIDLPNNVATPIISITVDDYAPNSRQQSFLISFDGETTLGGPNFGGILAQFECNWSLVDMVFEDSVRTVAIGLQYSPQEGLTAYSRPGAEQADLSLTYDPHQFAFFTNALQIPFGD